MFYLETSAAAKLVLSERGSVALRRWLAPRAALVFSSDLLRTELPRLARRASPDLVLQARAVLEGIVLTSLATDTFERASMLEPTLLQASTRCTSPRPSTSGRASTASSPTTCA